MLRAEALAYIRDTMGGIMKGRTMLVGFSTTADPSARRHPSPG